MLPEGENTIKRVRRVGQYQLSERIGQGGMGEIWKGHHAELGRTCAIKILHTKDEDDILRFKREARVVARLNHPNIAQLFEVGEDWERPYIAMQYIEGSPIDMAPLTLKGKVTALRDAARAVHHAHEMGILHRDLKPANIMVDGDGRGIVLDFGLAREVQSGDSSLSMTGNILGTPAYMSPEQGRGDLRALKETTDVYGLGATLYHLLTGRPPFDAEGALQVVMKVVNDDPTPPHTILSMVDRDLETIVLKSMEKEAARRYATAAAFADELDRYLRGEPITARPASMVYRIRKRIRRQPVAWALGTALVLALIAGTAIWMVNLDRALKAERKLRVDREKELEALTRRQKAEPMYHIAQRRYLLLRELRFLDRPIGKQRTMLVREIEDAASKALEVDPEYAEAVFLRGAALAEIAHMDEAAFKVAETDLTRVIEMKPSFTPARYMRGRLYMHRFVDNLMWDNLSSQDPLQSVKTHAEWKDRAVADFEKVRELGGDPEELNLAEVAVPLANLKFLEAVVKARKLLPKMARPNEVRLLLAVCTLYMFQVDSAEAEFRRVLKDWPRDRYARLLLVLIYTLRKPDYEKAREEAKVVLQDEPDNLFARLGRAEANRLLGDHEKARKDFEFVLARRDHSMAWLSLGRMLMAEKKPEPAVEKFNEAVRVAPKWGQPYIDRASAWKRLQKWKEAEADYTTLIGRTSKPSSSMYRARAYVRVKQEKLKEAIEDYGAAIQRKKSEPESWNGRGWLHLKIKAWSEAESDYTAYIALRDKDPNGFYRRGEARLMQKKYKGAVEDFERAKALGLKSTRLDQLLDRARRALGG